MEDPAPVPVGFHKNTFVQFIDAPKEVGVLKEEFNQEHNVTTSYYSTILDIIQEVIVDTQPITLYRKLFYVPCTKKCVAILKN